MTNFDYDLIKSMVRFKILDGEDVLMDKPLSFCNNDGSCQPCLDGDCSVAENSLTCGDCKSGSQDALCDLERDGICDPDCNGDLADTDCGRGCTDFCNPGDSCIGGQLVDSLDGSLCCIGGECGNLEEISAIQFAEQVTPFNVLEPEDAFVPSSSTVVTLATGEVVDINDPVADIPSEGFEEEPVITDLGNDENAESEEEYIARREASLATSLEEEEADRRADRIDEVANKLTGFNIYTFLIAAVLVIVIVSVIMTVMRKRTDSVMEDSAAQAAAEAVKKLKSSGPVSVSPMATSEVQRRIGILHEKGYSYAQVRNILINQKIEVKVVDQEIKKHYVKNK